MSDTHYRAATGVLAFVAISFIGLAVHFASQRSFTAAGFAVATAIIAWLVFVVTRSAAKGGPSVGLAAVYVIALVAFFAVFWQTLARGS